MEKAKPKINPEKFYSTKMLVQMGLFPVARDDKRRQMLWRYIRQRRIKSVNVGSEAQPRYVVQGKHLLEYLQGRMKPGEYAKK